MDEIPVSCIHCNKEITGYYDKMYKGIRGKCLSYEIDFPLE
ncbi:MAG: hypothetical protein OEL82_04160 [Nitrosopumilus sp.]|nr:hypothetical protein [Nitrosopumilus sp.]